MGYALFLVTPAVVRHTTTVRNSNKANKQKLQRMNNIYAMCMVKGLKYTNRRASQLGNQSVQFVHKTCHYHLWLRRLLALPCVYFFLCLTMRIQCDFFLYLALLPANHRSGIPGTIVFTEENCNGICNTYGSKNGNEGSNGSGNNMKCTKNYDYVA